VLAKIALDGAKDGCIVVDGENDRLGQTRLLRSGLDLVAIQAWD
jgi:hypothetical protein